MLHVTHCDMFLSINWKFLPQLWKAIVKNGIARLDFRIIELNFIFFSLTNKARELWLGILDVTSWKQRNMGESTTQNHRSLIKSSSHVNWNESFRNARPHVSQHFVVFFSADKNYSGSWMFIRWSTRAYVIWEIPKFTNARRLMKLFTAIRKQKQRRWGRGENSKQIIDRKFRARGLEKFVLFYYHYHRHQRT